MTMLFTRQSYSPNAGVERQKYAEKNDRALAKRTSYLVANEDNWGREFDIVRERWGKNYYRSEDDRGTRKVYGFIISPDPRDHVRPDDLADMAAEWASELYPDRQWVVLVHDDGSHNVMHAHVYVNSPEFLTGHVIKRSPRDIIREAELVQTLSAERGWSTMPVAGRRDLTPEELHSKISKERNALELRRDARRAQERHMEARGVKSWKGRMRDAIDDAIGESRSWLDFLERIEAKGYVPKVTARGITFYPIADENARPCKGVNLDNGVGDYSLESLNRRIVGDAAEGSKILQRDGRHVPTKYHDIKRWQTWRKTMVSKNALERERQRMELFGEDPDGQVRNALDWLKLNGMANLSQLRAHEESIAREVEQAERELADVRDLYENIRHAASTAREAWRIRDDMARGKGLSSDPERLAKCEREVTMRGYEADVTPRHIWNMAEGIDGRIARSEQRISRLKASLGDAAACEEVLRGARTTLTVTATFGYLQKEIVYAKDVVGRYDWRRTRGNKPRFHVSTWREMLHVNYDSVIKAVEEFQSGGHESYLLQQLKLRRETFLANVDLDAERAWRAAMQGRGSVSTAQKKTSAVEQMQRTQPDGQARGTSTTRTGQHIRRHY